MLRMSVFSMAAAAVVAPSFSPLQAQQTLVSPRVQLQAYEQRAGASNVSRLRIGNITNPKCRGVGKQTKGRFQSFYCSVAWSFKSDISHTVTQANLYVRPWTSTQVCASARSLADCPPVQVRAPLPGDPRCGIRSQDCMASSAATAIRAELKKRGLFDQLGSACLAVTAFVYHCVPANDPHDPNFPTNATVKWTQGKKAWTMVVTLAP